MKRLENFDGYLKMKFPVVAVLVITGISFTIAILAITAMVTALISILLIPLCKLISNKQVNFLTPCNYHVIE